MARIAQFSHLILSTTLLLLFSAGCWQGNEVVNPAVREINDPGELPQELRDFEFFLYKTGDFGSLVSVQNLALETIRTFHTDRFISGVDLTSDGKYLVYNQVSSYAGVSADLVLRLNLENKNILRIAGRWKDYTEFAIDAPSISPDDRTVLYTTYDFRKQEYGLGRVGLDGKNHEFLETDKRLVHGPASSPDGSLILVFCGGYGEEYNHLGLCLLDEEGKFIRYIADDSSIQSNYQFSPGGEKVVYADLGPPIYWFLVPNRYRFFVFDLLTNERKLLLTWDVELLEFSSDGDQIIFRGGPNSKAPGSIYIMNLDGTNLRHLAYYDEFLEDWYADADQY